MLNLKILESRGAFKNKELAVECFAKITDVMGQGTQMYISVDKAKPILKPGLIAEDPLVRENSDRARENLLRLGLPPSRTV